MPALSTFKDMPLWQRSMQLAIEVCQSSLQLPGSGKLVVTTEIQHAAIAIPTALARGSVSGKQGLLAALASSRASAAELETLLIMMQNLAKDKAIDELLVRVDELQISLNNTARRLSDSRPPKTI